MSAAPRPALRRNVRAQQPAPPSCCHTVATVTGSDGSGNYLVVLPQGGDPIAAPTLNGQSLTAGQVVLVHRGAQGALLILGFIPPLKGV